MQICVSTGHMKQCSECSHSSASHLHLWHSTWLWYIHCNPTETIYPSLNEKNKLKNTKWGGYTTNVGMSSHQLAVNRVTLSLEAFFSKSQFRGNHYKNMIYLAYFEFKDNIMMLLKSKIALIFVNHSFENSDRINCIFCKANSLFH